MPEKDVTYYYEKIHFEDENKEAVGVFTVCLLKDGDSYHRGIAYCTTADQFEKAKGREIAIARAMKARDSHANSEVPPKFITILSFIHLKHDFMFPNAYLSQCNVQLTRKEKRLTKLPEAK